MASPCLLPLLQPVRSCFQPFLSSKDAAHFMQASRSITASLLPGYAFVDHEFDYRTLNASAADIQRSLAFYARYHLRITRIALPTLWNEPLVDADTGLAVLPASLTALTFGRTERAPTRRPHQRPLYPAFDERDYPEADDEDAKEGEEGIEELRHRIRSVNVGIGWDNDSLSIAQDPAKYDGQFNQPIPPGALPHGLRFLHFSDLFDQPLQQGSIPATVEVLHFGGGFHQPLEIGHLPVSLTHLVFGVWRNRPLLPGALPAGLQQLFMGGCYDQPLLSGLLPAQLRVLHLGVNFRLDLVPGAVPPSVTDLRLSLCFDQPLQRGSIPHGVVYLLIGENFNQPLLPGVLPSSLRHLAIGMRFNQPLQPGSLPDGLQVLAFHQRSYFQHVLQPGVVPASVEVVSMGRKYNQPLVRDGIASTVRWLRLPHRVDEDVSAVLSPSTRVVHWSG